MPTFKYHARDAVGRAASGTGTAATIEQLAAELRERGLLVLRVEKTDERPPRRPLHLNPLWWVPPSKLDIELGLQQLAAMLHSGLTLLSALRTVGEQAGKPRATAMWQDLRERIEQGATLSGALATYPKAFSGYVVQLVKVGEHSGELDLMLTRAAEHLEQTRNTRLMVVNALTYPILVTLMAVGVSCFMVLNVIPKIQQFLTGRGRALPRMTQMLLDVSDWLRLYLPYIGIGMIAAVVALWAVHRWLPGRRVIHALLLRVPMVGPTLRLAGTAAFSRGLGILIESGVTLLDGLQTAEHLVGNLALSRRIASARVSVMRGERLAGSLTGKYEFLPMLSRMVAVGEETGTLGRALSDAARFHEARLVATIRRLSVMIEPIMILVVGTIVGFVYIAFFVALFSLATSMR